MSENSIFFSQIQFAIIFFHNFQVLFRQCDYPKFIAFLLGTQAMFFMYLFGSFYKKQYLSNNKAKVFNDNGCNLSVKLKSS